MPVTDISASSYSGALWMRQSPSGTRNGHGGARFLLSPWLAAGSPEEVLMPQHPNPSPSLSLPTWGGWGSGSRSQPTAPAWMRSPVLGLPLSHQAKCLINTTRVGSALPGGKMAASGAKPHLLNLTVKSALCFRCRRDVPGLRSCERFCGRLW